MKKAVALFLVLTFVICGIAPSFALDTQKLMLLKPLPSQRLEKIANDYERNKTWGAIAGGILGLSMLLSSATSVSGDPKVSNLTNDYFLVLFAAAMYLTPGIYKVDSKVFSDLQLQGTEKETVIYSHMKAMAAETKQNRTFFGIVSALLGVGWAILSNNVIGASQSYRNSSDVVSIALLGVGIFLYCVQSDVEKEVIEMDKSLTNS